MTILGSQLTSSSHASASRIDRNTATSFVLCGSMLRCAWYMRPRPNAKSSVATMANFEVGAPVSMCADNDAS
jgi:hypothetical protein